MQAPKPGTAPTPLHLLAMFGLSAAVLAFEVLLLRLFEFSHWHHFAGLAVSLALLGLGTAGTVLAALGDGPVRWGERWFLGGLLTAALGLLLVLFVHAGVALRPAFAAWNLGELARLLLVDFTAFLPFFGAGLAIGQMFTRWPEYSGRVYAANLFGSGAGSVAASCLLIWLPAESALALVALALPLFGVVLAVMQRLGRATVASVAVTALALPAVIWTPMPAVSDFKALARLQELPGAQTLATEPGLSGRLTVLRADSLRFAPGLSLSWTEPVPSMDAAVLGSDRIVPLARRYATAPPYGQAMLANLPLQLRPEGRLLVLGTSQWQTPAIAGERAVDWVEPDGRLLQRWRERGAGRGDSRLIEDGLYRHLAAGGSRYPLITLDVAHGGGDAATEDYLMTVDGLLRGIQRLEADGLMAIPLSINYPPRDFPRALATIIEALQRQGIRDAAHHVAILRSLQSAIVLVRPTPLSDPDIRSVERFAQRWRFDTVWLPGMPREAANQHHRLDTPAFHDSARALFTEQSLPDAARWFTAEPATLGRPYFWRSLRWDRVGPLWNDLGQRGLSYLDWTLLMGVASTLAATVLGAALILAPLGRLPAHGGTLGRTSVLGYFAALGLGYMLLEMAIFQRAILFLGEPVLAASAVFALFLLGSGIGSALAPTQRRRSVVGRIYLPIAVTMLIAAVVLWPATPALLTPGFGLRTAVLAALLLPLTWSMGRPFPWGLSQLAGRQRWVPWAWGINGFASVVAASLAPLVSVHFGQLATFAAGAACYVMAAGIGWHWAKGARRETG